MALFYRSSSGSARVAERWHWHWRALTGAGLSSGGAT